MNDADSAARMRSPVIQMTGAVRIALVALAPPARAQATGDSGEL